MKIISLERSLHERLTLPPSAIFLPDSAVVPSGRPLFVPDFSGQWVGRLYMAARIGRLGKNIPQRFASRYCDSLGLALRLIPLDLLRQLEQEERGIAVATGFDNAISLSISLPFDSSLSSYEIDCMGETQIFTPEEIAIDESIVELSRYMTLKTGDVILTGHTDNELSINIDTTIEASLNGERQLRIKLK